jgi:diguanylate cyclase (GGDEF)-like protein
MAKALTVMVLTPSLGGDFFGDILSGITRAVAAEDGGRVVVVETLQEYAIRDEAGTPGDFSTRVGWSNVDGVISLTTAAGSDYLHAVRAAGKPVVLLSSTQLAGFDAPSVRPDNRRGTIVAVNHLMDHGRTRVGFVGNLAQLDIADRHAAYREALTDRGVTVNPDFLFAAPNNGESGGAVAARAFLSAPQRPDALMIATDRNAVGFMDEVRAAGLKVPRDLAIVSFDNNANAAFTIPPLSSVDPRFDRVGALAGRLVLAAARGENVPISVFAPESAVLESRESCGCEAMDRRTISLDGDFESIDAPAGHRRLEDVLMRELGSGDPDRDREYLPAVREVTREAVRMLERGDEATQAEIEGFVTSLLELVALPATLRRYMAGLADYGRRSRLVPEDMTGSRSRPTTRLEVALWRAQAGAFLRQAEVTDHAITEQYIVDAGLLETGGADPRDLAWLEGTHVKSCALALWSDGPAEGQLTIVGSYDPGGVTRGLVGSEVSSESFPPNEFVANAIAPAGEVCVVVPVSNRERDWGLLALVAEIDPTTSRETYQHWAALLCAALESQRRQDEVRRSALYDSLTGLPNRSLFVQRLELAIERHREDATPFSVLFLDLDGFKLINDSLGHPMGDRVLQAAAAEISTTLRDNDTAARFGGDEFVILLENTGSAEAVLGAQDVQAALSRVREFDGHEIVTRASIGIASSEVGYSTAEEVLRDADDAMYRAKAAEPGTFAVFDAQMHEDALRRASLALEVLRGLHEAEFEVHYQPIVNLETGRTDRFEALVRWRHPERGLIAPDDFLGDLVDSSIIVQLGHWVLEEVCRQLTEWGPGVTNVSINVSDKEFWSQDLLTNTLTALERHRLEPGRLTLEVTEDVLMRRPEMALRIMHRLHDSGLRLHIDDFGTGYSSLETLHRFPVEAFKIDRSFIQTLASGENSAELISSLVKLGNSLGLSVVAEGVETDEQLAFLQKLGCAAGQGYLFMPAVSATEAKDLLDKQARGDA